MGRIVVIRHHTEPRGFHRFTLHRVLTECRERGHEVSVVYGCDRLPDGDLAILHVNLSIVPQAYAAAARHYPRVVNGDGLDIRKRRVSRLLLARDDGWNGPVIVKSDLNFGGWPEWHARERALAQGMRAIDAPRPIDTSYPIYRTSGEVPARIWSSPHLVVEKFLPERDDRGFYTRSWLFLGDEGRCKRCRSAHPIVKGPGIIDAEEVSVPEFIREERRRLAIDYGKFDFVIHRGEPILLDANKTPGEPPSRRAGKRYSNLARGLESLLCAGSLPA